MNEVTQIDTGATLVTPVANTPMAIIERAIASGASPETLSKLMDLQERDRARADALEEAALVIENGQECYHSEDQSYHIEPRGSGNQIGLAYVTAIRALKDAKP